jgi:hypothetical protein
MSQISLEPNEKRIQWPPVRWADGSRLPVILEPGEGWFDGQGYLRMFSLPDPDDGSTTNYQLLPRDQTTDRVLHFVSEILLPLGMSLVGGMIRAAGGTIVTNVAGWLFDAVGPRGEVMIRDYFERTRIENSGYYKMETGSLLLVEPLRRNR